MTGNTYGEKFRVTTFGESHGKAVGVVIDGVPSRLKLSVEDIQKELDRRRPGQSIITTQRQEEDKAEILSGVFEGQTLSTPICIIVWNEEKRSEDYENIKNIFRPGHADFSYYAKYGIYDYRGGGRASGRETIGRVAAGAIAKKILAQHRIKIVAYTKSIAGIEAKKIDYAEIEKNIVRCPDANAAKKMVKKILEVQKTGDSVGGIVEAVVQGCPPGLGDPVFNKLDAELAKAMLSIPAVKGFEIGSGFHSAEIYGSENNDEFYFDKKLKRIRTKTNNAGGVIGGITTGEDIVFRIAVKPTSSIAMSQNTIGLNGTTKKISIGGSPAYVSERIQEITTAGNPAYVSGRIQEITTAGRHDPCVCPRIVPVAEAMAALVLVNML